MNVSLCSCLKKPVQFRASGGHSRTPFPCRDHFLAHHLSAPAEDSRSAERRHRFRQELRLQLDSGYVLPPVPAADADEASVRQWLALLSNGVAMDAATNEVRVGPGEPMTVR